MCDFWVETWPPLDVVPKITRDWDHFASPDPWCISYDASRTIL